MDRSSIGITMIGHSGTGKTCYLYAMYAKMAFGVNGFTFMPVDYDQSLDLENGWQMIASKNTWPPGSGNSSDFVLTCSHAFRPLIDFTWHDYRGDIISERAAGKESDRQILFNHLHSSSTLILCISAEMLKAVVHGDAGVDGDLRKYLRLLQAFQVEQKQTVPLAVTIMKADAISDDELSKGLDILREYCFGPLMQPGGGWLVMFTWVSLGENLGKVGQQGITGRIKPSNIHVPVMFGIYSVFNRALTDIIGERNNLGGALQSATNALENENSRGLLQRIIGTSQQPALSANVEQLKAKLGAVEKDLSRLEADLNRVVSELGSDVCRIYWEGQRVNEVKGGEAFKRA